MSQCNLNFRIKGMYGPCITHQKTKATMHSTLSKIVYCGQILIFRTQYLNMTYYWVYMLKCLKAKKVKQESPAFLLLITVILGHMGSFFNL